MICNILQIIIQILSVFLKARKYDRRLPGIYTFFYICNYHLIAIRIFAYKCISLMNITSAFKGIDRSCISREYIMPDSLSDCPLF